MKSFQITTMLAAIAAVVAGAPVNDAPLEKRDNSGLEVCTDVGFKGRCIHLVNPFNDCINFDGNFNDQASALGPDRGSRCSFFRDSGCTGASFDQLVYPGYSDLSQVSGGVFNDAISSYICIPT